MNKQTIRDLALALLDDEDGINSTGFDILSDLLKDTGNDDILNSVNAIDGRYFVGEDDAEILRKNS
jgi:hypothetical protein